jgi:exodeoxyribonuclease III
MKIATFNANSIRSRLDVIREWLGRQSPDVVCLQETKCQDQDFPEAAITGLGYHVVYRGEKSYNGVAIISREPPLEVRFGIPDGEPADETRLACCRIGSVTLVNTYVPQGREIDHPMYQYKLRWFARLRGFFSQNFTPRMKILWLGDLNVAPQSIDIHNAEQQLQHVCYHEDVRRAFENTVQWGFVDVFRKHQPGPGQYTFFDYRTPNAVRRKMGWRIDHMLATPPLAATSRDCFIDLQPRLQPKASDHTFLCAEFDV